MSARLPPAGFSVNAALGWAIAAAGVVAGTLLYGWQGTLLALSVVVFWLLLQFSRALRTLRDAAQRPIGTVVSAIMFNTRVQRGQPLVQLVRMTGSLGERIAEVPETWRWRDSGGDAVVVELAAGRVSAWRLERAPSARDAAPGHEAEGA
jgi:hypothetical protein